MPEEERLGERGIVMSRRKSPKTVTHRGEQDHDDDVGDGRVKQANSRLNTALMLDSDLFIGKVGRFEVGQFGDDFGVGSA